MPREVRDVGAEKRQTKNHLALITDESGLATAIPPGAGLFLIDDGDVYPMFLRSVSVKRLVFTVGDTDYEYTLTKGKPLTREALKRMRGK